jgi:hypothetical protein
MGIALVGLLIPSSVMFIYGQQAAYGFFIPHLFVVGYLGYRYGSYPKILGILLIIASLCYIIMTYGEHVFTDKTMEMLFGIVVLPAMLGELLLAIWMLVRGGKEKKIEKEDAGPGVEEDPSLKESSNTG